jgi:prepilin-type N-terminal cleavage/methylation domain-containing protein
MPPRPRPGFTLIELLVVVTIVVLVSAATLPTILPALAHRQVSEASRLLQAAIEGARDAARG